jgi:hypothetical protein
VKSLVAIFLVNVLLAAFFFITPAEINASADRSKEVERYVEIFSSGTLSRQITAAKEITRSGLSDPKLFDLLNEKLLDNYLQVSGPDHLDYLAWLCKALASSGLQQYKPTLEKVAETTTEPKLERYVRQSLDLFEQYAEINKIISDEGNASPDRDPEVVKIINMLKSDMMKLKRDAAKMVVRRDFPDPVIYEIINDELRAGYSSITDSIAIDTMAWLCKALANSGNPLHKETLKEIAASSNNLKLAMNADKALKSMLATAETGIKRPSVP